MGRRIETTDYLKECIADATIKLMRKRSLEQLTIQEITDLAGVGRATYFRNFTSKSEVLTFKLNLLWNTWSEKTPFPETGDDYEQALWFFSFCDSIKPLLKLLFLNDQSNVLLEACLAYTEPIAKENGGGMHEQYLRVYHAYGILGVVTEWSKNKFEASPEQLARLFTTPVT